MPGVRPSGDAGVAGERPLAAAAFVVLLIVSGCSGDDSTKLAGRSRSTVSESTTTTTSRRGTTSLPSLTSTTAPTDLVDGRHPAWVTGVDVEARTITVDVIQWLSGEEAQRAWARDNPDDPDGPPNDYYIVNENPRQRMLRVAPAVAVRLVRLHEDGDADLDRGTFEELPSYFRSEQGFEPEPPLLWHNPFWLTLTRGEVTELEEQYRP